MKKLILSIMTLVSFSCFAGWTTNYQAVVTATTTSTKYLNANGGRSYLLVLNTGSNPISVKFDSIHTSSEGITIAGSGGYYEPVKAPSGQLWIKTGSSTSTVFILEGVAQ